jgi:hypothetical protein
MNQTKYQESLSRIQASDDFKARTVDLLGQMASPESDGEVLRERTAAPRRLGFRLTRRMAAVGLAICLFASVALAVTFFGVSTVQDQQGSFHITGQADPLPVPDALIEAAAARAVAVSAWTEGDVAYTNYQLSFSSLSEASLFFGLSLDSPYFNTAQRQDSVYGVDGPYTDTEQPIRADIFAVEGLPSSAWLLVPFYVDDQYFTAQILLPFSEEPLAVDTEGLEGRLISYVSPVNGITADVICTDASAAASDVETGAYGTNIFAITSFLHNGVYYILSEYTFPGDPDLNLLTTVIDAFA